MHSTDRPAHRAAPAVAWTIAVSAVVVLLASSAGVLSGVVRGIERVEALWILSWPGLPIVGAIIVSRRPGNRVGWLLLGIGCGIAAGIAAESYATFGITPISPPWELAVFLTVEAFGFNLAFGLVPLLLLYFPEGRRDGGLHAWLARATVLLVALSTLAWIIRDGQSLSNGTPLPNPLAPPVLGAVADAATGPLAVGLVLCGLAAIGDTAVRYRRSVGIERLQRRWFVLVATSLPIMLWAGVVVSGVVDTVVGKVVQYATWVIGLNGLAAGIGIAVLRYRLYEIDRVVSRTVTYAFVTAALVAVYAAVVVLPSAVVELRSDLLVAAATLAAAGAFGPVRRRVQSAVDRRFNRSRYDAQRLMEGFGLRVRSELDLADLRVDLGRVIGATVQPAHLSVWMPGGGSGRRWHR